MDLHVPCEEAECIFSSPITCAQHGFDASGKTLESGQRLYHWGRAKRVGGSEVSWRLVWQDDR